MQNKNVDRAKQFLPFEALKGFKEAIRMIENKGDTKKELSEDNKNDINNILKKLEKEIKRSEGMTKIAEQIIRNGELAYKTMVHMDEYRYDATRPAPEMLEVRTQGKGGGNINGK